MRVCWGGGGEGEGEGGRGEREMKSTAVHGCCLVRQCDNYASLPHSNAM